MRACLRIDGVLRWVTRVSSLLPYHMTNRTHSAFSTPATYMLTQDREKQTYTLMSGAGLGCGDQTHTHALAGRGMRARRISSHHAEAPPSSLACAWAAADGGVAVIGARQTSCSAVCSVAS